MRNLLRLDLTMPVGNISKNIRKEIVQVLTELKVNLKAPLSFREAQVTSGGVSTDKIDPRTMGPRSARVFFLQARSWISTVTVGV